MLHICGKYKTTALFKRQVTLINEIQLLGKIT